MKLEEINKLEEWYLKGFVALHLWNTNLLAVACALATTAVFLYPTFILKDHFGDLAAWLFYIVTYFLFSKYIGFWIVNPLCGQYILAKAQRTYGPKTRRKILEWVIEPFSDDAKEPLNIAALARTQGEFN